MRGQSLIRVKNIVTNEEIAHYEQSPFVTMFLIVVCCRGVRKRLHVGKGQQSPAFYTVSPDSYKHLQQETLKNIGKICKISINEV